MKRTIYTLILLVAAAALVAGCGGNSKAEVGNPGQSALPTATPTPEPQITEEFQSGTMETWSDPLFVVGNPKMSEITAEGKSLLFTLRDVETYSYKFYDEKVFENVIVEAEVTNLGDNTNGISLICRASEEGWYEFRVASGGTYEVYRYDQKMKDRGENPYNMIDSGGSGLINAKTNQLKFACNGSSLQIFSNGKEIKPPRGPMEDSTYTKGKIGVGVMSFGRVPVKVAFDKVSITEPE